MFTRKKKGTMLAKRSGTDVPRQVVNKDKADDPRYLAKRDTAEVQSQVVNKDKADDPRYLSKRDKVADPHPRKVAQLVLERIENFPETYYQSQWWQIGGSVRPSFNLNPPICGSSAN